MSSTAERIPFEDAAAPRAVRKRVAEILGRGGLVALPTETVYGIAARADDGAALERHCGGRFVLVRRPGAGGDDRRPRSLDHVAGW